jgi:hypothetical protein
VRRIRPLMAAARVKRQSLPVAAGARRAEFASKPPLNRVRARAY